MYKFLLISVVLLIMLNGSCTSTRNITNIQEEQIRSHVKYLASDMLEGRYPGTEGDIKAGKYIDGWFSKQQLKPEYQPFPFLLSMTAGKNNALEINGIPLPDKSFAPFGFSKDTLVEGEMVFAGYGISAKADSFEWNDYKDRDVKGKVVMVLEGYPAIPEGDQYLYYTADARDKAMLASDMGAAGLLIISEDKIGQDQEISLGRQAATDIPVFSISAAAADSMLKITGISVLQLKDNAAKYQIQTNLKPAVRIRLQSDIDPVTGSTGNHYTVLEGSDPVLKHEYVIIGAHMDHLGNGGKGNSRNPDTIAVHNGADDNASGVAAMLHAAFELSRSRNLLKRSVIFVAFGGEEMGLLGSKYFVNHPPVPLEKITAMINLDMVGRFDSEKGIQIGGVGTSAEGDSLINVINSNRVLKLNLIRDGNGPSDHASFYTRNIPVFFFTTGAHTDYHTPFDDFEKINITGLIEISHMVVSLTREICNHNEALAFRESGSRETATPRQRLKVTLGFMPDFSATDVEGVRVDLVSKGKAAERGGIKNGDVIVAIEGKPVKNIYDYMYRLTKLSRGQIISVEILRSGKKEVLLIQL